MLETIVAVYHTIQDTSSLRRALEEIGTAPDNLHTRPHGPRLHAELRAC
jgi:hypothetical protein